jgi:hypothetical protein
MSDLFSCWRAQPRTDISTPTRIASIRPANTVNAVVASPSGAAVGTCLGPPLDGYKEIERMIFNEMRFG